ncbi:MULTISPECIES: hypothetical protein [Paraburkholderia]|uniref:hypothetical protein n=1 Tax=Paraburkholderia TaxID=1822464 RepID=UPI00039E3815|nr:MULTISPECIES: hypothetical protein [Paraburkholderia]MDH6148211.1 hypothetical protein [Paraburkholderia sp. WSM4179]
MTTTQHACVILQHRASGLDTRSFLVERISSHEKNWYYQSMRDGQLQRVAARIRDVQTLDAALCIR